MVARIFTLLLAPFAFKLVNYLRHSEILKFRKNSSAGAAILVAVLAGAFMMFSCSVAFSYDEYVEQVAIEVCQVSKKGPVVVEEYRELVDLWMCSTDCRCYEGAGGYIKEMWKAYGEEAVIPYSRTVGEKAVKKGNITAYPLQWTNDEKTAIHTFK